MGLTYMSCMAIYSKYSKYATEMISMKNSIVILIDSNGKTHSQPHSQQAFNLGPACVATEKMLETSNSVYSRLPVLVVANSEVRVNVT